MINYKPPYWYHDNIKFSEEELNSLKRELDTLGSEKYTENKQCITTFFLEDELRPEMKYKDKYFNIAEQITKNAGIFKTTPQRAKDSWSMKTKDGNQDLRWLL